MMNSHLIVCENIRSAYNVGNIIRTADGLGRGVLLSGYSAPISHPKVRKTALGGEESVRSHHITHPDETLIRLQDHDYTIIAAEHSKTSQALGSTDTHYGERIAVVVGNEITGVRSETLEASDYVVHIPMLGTKESLNV
jgi:tRNA G18 (ribose-2'-O)-methylase SpoU